MLPKQQSRDGVKLKKILLLLTAIVIVLISVLIFMKKDFQAKGQTKNQARNEKAAVQQINIDNPVVYKPKQGVKATVNPYMGFAPAADGGPYAQPHSLVYADYTWRNLEPQKGKFDFAGIEKKWQVDYWRQKNIKVIFRVILDDPREDKHMDIPDWLYEEIKHDGTWYNHSWGKGFSPNYANKTLIAYHEQLIKKLAERYNHDPEIAFVALGSIGHWGEWHTLQQDGIYIPFPKLPVAEQYINPYIKYFDNKILLMRRPLQIAKDHNMGLYDDMFGNKSDTVGEYWSWVTKGYTFWLTDEKMPAMPDFWKTAPSGGEMRPTDNWNDYFSAAHLTETMRELELTHVSWLGPFSPTEDDQPKDRQQRIKQFLGKMGYHFRLVQERHPEKAKPGDLIQLSMDWENSGVAPFYFNWPVEISLANQTGEIVFHQKLKADIKKWLPGNQQISETIQLPADLKPGEYHLCTAILDPDKKKPGIQLEMEGKRMDGRYQLGQITIQ